MRHSVIFSKPLIGAGKKNSFQFHCHLCFRLSLASKCPHTIEEKLSVVAQGNLEGALQLLAVVLNNPAGEQNSLNRAGRLRDEAEKLQAQVENQLDSDRYKAAGEAGQRQRLADVVTQILN